MLSPDDVLQNRYRIIRPLGQGGMGTVYEAVDQRVNAIVAVKETQAPPGSNSRREFEREAGLLANLQHQSLPKVMDYFTEGRGEYLVMEFIPGFDLLTLLERRGGPFHPGQVFKWADNVLRVLEYLHGLRPAILHRDIKPSNLKLSPEEEVYLLDFGLAKGRTGQMPTLVTNRSVRGYTPVYSPIEQILGQGTDARSDLYALGATLYHLLTGVPPADAVERDEQLADGKPDPLLPIQQLNPRVPAGFAGVIHHALQVRRKFRPESATAMRAELRRVEETAKGAIATDPVLEAERQRAHAPTQQVAAPFTNPYAPPPRPQAPAPFPAGPHRNPLAILIAAGVGVLLITVLVLALARRSGTNDGFGTNGNATPSTSPGIPGGAGGASPGQIVPKSFTEKVGGQPLEMVLLPGGEFMMGSPAGEGYNSERPQHRVTVPAYYISKYEVTQALWKAVMRDNPSGFVGDNLPVDSVSWDDAQEFCRRLSSRTGREYRLPTEAEWEYACRGGTTSIYAFGDTITAGNANYDASTQNGPFLKMTAPVGSYQPNWYGLYDMHGNVWEWCLDVYHSSYEGAPTDGSAWVSVAGPRVLRGGAWISDPDGLRSAVRERSAPETRRPSFGFRLALTLRQ